MNEYLVELLRKGKLRRSKSPFCASLSLVKEKDKLRAVVDYLVLNLLTKRNNAPLPLPDKMFHRLAGARYLLRLYLKTWFHHIFFRPEYIRNTALNNRYGPLENLVLPMDLCNAPETFQTLINQIFHDCIDFSWIYIDDRLIYSITRAQHLQHLETVLLRLKKEDLYGSSKKFYFMQPETEFLGLIVSEHGTHVNPQKL